MRTTPSRNFLMGVVAIVQYARLEDRAEPVGDCTNLLLPSRLESVRSLLCLFFRAGVVPPPVRVGTPNLFVVEEASDIDPDPHKVGVRGVAGAAGLVPELKSEGQVELLGEVQEHLGQPPQLENEVHIVARVVGALGGHSSVLSSCCHAAKLRSIYIISQK